MGEGKETAEGGGAAAGRGFVAGGLGTGLTKSAELDSIALRSFGWGEAAALTNVGGGAPSAFCFCGLGWWDATAFASFGAGAGFTSAIEDEGNTVWDEVFSRVPLLGLGFPAGACKPVFGTEPE